MVSKITLSFSTLKAGRDLAAARMSRGADHRSSFQYPQSGSRPCRIAQFNGAGLPTEAFSTLKAGRDLAAFTEDIGQESVLCFQYPQSGSRPCRAQLAL